MQTLDAFKVRGGDGLEAIHDHAGDPLTVLDLPLIVGIATEMADLCQRADMRIMPSCGHNVPFEQPDALSREVTEFLQRDC